MTSKYVRNKKRDIAFTQYPSIFSTSSGGILAENLFIFNCFIHFTYHRNAVKSTFSLQMPLVNYSHSIVAGGLLVMSYTTRLMCSTSFTIRVEIFSNTSHGMRAQSDVIPSMDVTARIPMV